MKKNEKFLEEFYEELVPITVLRPAGTPIGGSHTVTLNGKNYQIRYDEEVMVPRKIALILEEKARNEKRLELRMEKMAGVIQNLDGE